MDYAQLQKEIEVAFETIVQLTEAKEKSSNTGT